MSNDDISAVSPRRENLNIVFRTVAFVLPIFALGSVFIGFPDNWTLGIFLGSILVLTFAAFPATGRAADQSGVPWYDWLAIAASIGTIGYYVLAYEDLNLYIGGYSDWQHGVMALAILLTLEAARRATGFVVPMIGISLIVYSLSQGFPESMILTRIYVGESGMFGTLTDIFLRYVFLFFIFGALMERSGAAEFLRRYLAAVTGKVTAGAAKATIVGSGVLGSFMGSSSGNVAVTGTLTIPMMRREGYPAPKAAAIETSSSLGGELSPPIMGSAIFLLVAYTGTSYVDVILISILPAIIYYTPIYMIVHFEGLRDGRRADMAASGESSWKILFDFKHLVVPPIVLVALIAMGYSPTYGAAGGIIAAVVLGAIQKRNRLSARDLFRTVSDGTLNFMMLGATAPVLGIILVVVLLTGIPTMMTSFTIGMVGSQLLLVMAAIFVLALGLGMGMPIVAAYMILATVAAPALTAFQIPLLTAHLFILWFTQTAAVTPPLGLATYVAAGIARTSMWTTAYEAMRLGVAMFVVPLLMVFGGILSPDVGTRFWSFAQIMLGFILWSAITAGFVKSPIPLWGRAVMALIIVGLCLPPFWLNLASFAAGVLAMAYLWLGKTAPAVSRATS